MGLGVGLGARVGLKVGVGTRLGFKVGMGVGIAEDVGVGSGAGVAVCLRTGTVEAGVEAGNEVGTESAVGVGTGRAFAVGIAVWLGGMVGIAAGATVAGPGGWAVSPWQAANIRVAPATVSPNARLRNPFMRTIIDLG